MLEYLGGSVVYSVLKDLWGAIRGRRRRLTPEKVLELRQKWKKEIEPTIRKRRREGLAMDVVIRDVRRLDHYPHKTDANRKGISGWFKAGLSATYHNGIEVNLGWHGLVQDVNGWRLQNYLAGEKDAVTAALVASIPYERIEAVDWDGDDYYGETQVYCHFEGVRGSPYNADMYFGRIEQNPGGPEFYLKVATYDEVENNSKRAGTWWKKRKPLLERLKWWPNKEDRA